MHLHYDQGKQILRENTLNENTFIRQSKDEWSKKKLADKLELSPSTQKIQIVDFALDILKTSPLLKGKFPNIRKKEPRKREDYKCGHCGKKKKNHTCVASNNMDIRMADLGQYGLEDNGAGEGGIATAQVLDGQNGGMEGGYMDVPSYGNNMLGLLSVDEGIVSNGSSPNGNQRVNHQFLTVDDLGDMEPPVRKKRKIMFSLVVHFEENENTSVQQFLDEVKEIGEDNVIPMLRLTHANNERGYNIIGEIAVNTTSQPTYIGCIAEEFVQAVKKAIDDNVISEISLSPLQKWSYDNSHWLVRFILFSSRDWERYTSSDTLLYSNTFESYPKDILRY
eukprot:TRINITY_DN9503_c0_g1_i1.p1 TRINITY_DN9503_c0_g1~~TRINITY_DN9503_c0_g1_i1.p1  ORF type:complete len:349 (-),score=48.60 TRINITY_DN9503_c0_g1_i1:34-1041(-)